MVIILDELGVAEDAQNRNGAGRDKSRVNGCVQIFPSTRYPPIRTREEVPAA